MNLSPEMLERFERLYLEQQDYYWRDKPYPKELEDDPDLHEQFTDWRVEYKDAPRARAASQYMKDYFAEEDRKAAAQQAGAEQQGNDLQQA